MKMTRTSKKPHLYFWQKVGLVVGLSLLAVALAPPLAHTSASAEVLDAASEPAAIVYVMPADAPAE